MNGRLSMETTTTDWGVSYFASEYSMGIQKYNYKNYYLHTQQNIENKFTN
jgi:hypothetical protein